MMKIIESKLSIPDFSPYLVRDRLFSFLEKNLDRSLVCLTGDAGYGKTTLLSSFIKIKEIPTVWYQVGHADRYPHVFLSYLKAGVSRIMQHEVEAVYVQPECIEEELQQLLNLLSTWPTRLLIVLDDYQWVDQSKQIQEMVAKLALHSAKTITFVITSRVRPALPLVKLRLQQNLVELKTRDLAFSKEETNQFFNQLHHLHLQEHEIEFVVSRTEGWIASLQLIYDLIKEMSNAQRHRFWSDFKGIPDLYDYLGSEVLASQPDDIQQFLCKTSLLAELQENIVNQYLDIDDTKSVLDHLLAHHLFIYRTEEGAYKYHQLLRMFLYERLIKKSDQQQINAYHQKLAHIYEGNYQFFNAFAHYIAGKNYMSAANVMRQMTERYHPDQFMILLDGWLETISPDLSLVSTNSFLLRCLPISILDEIVVFLEKRITALKQKQNPLTIAHYQHRLATIQFFRGDLALSENLYLESLDASLATNDYGLIAINLSMLGQVYLFLKDFETAFHFIKRSLSYSEPYGISFSQMHSLWVLSEIYLAQNDLDKAEPIIRQTIAVSRQCDEASIVFPYCSMVKLLRLRGKYAQAIEWAVDALHHADKLNIEPDTGWVYMELGLTYLANGQMQEAKTYLKKAEEKLKRQLCSYLKEEIEKLQSRNDVHSIEVLQRQPDILTIRTLGPFSMEYGGQPIRLHRKSSLRLLLYFIANRERKLIKDSILDQVFPNGSFQSINNQFYVALSALRKALEPTLQSGRQSRFFIQSGEHYTFVAKELMLDADRFLQLAADQPDGGQAKRIERLRQSEQLYSGDFLEEYPYESYLEAEREKLRRVYLNLLRELAGYYWECNDYPNGMNYYEKLLEKDPYLENVYVEYVERLLQAKLGSNAREVSERGNKYIEQELGIPMQGSIDKLFRKYSL
ncbi:BTAD domain-containing putative transcriptional regulator [Brevibacillus sp. NRS-1366]|uniref:BTAD domain-containing putative transcriptional regulator n=1 Tax=Brevibacillus sp. NRS-1366 TaxID=3233899 RepID=UPI003D1C848D